jgi:superoxide dismutase, Fe-Mn family
MTTRRDFLKTGSLIAGAAMLPASAPLVARTELNEDSTMTLVPAFAPVHELKPLSFDPSKLNGLSERLVRSHWENNYGGSVKTLNAVKQRLAEALANKDTPPFLYNGLKREHLMRTGSVVLHELYFDNLGGDGKAGEEMRKALGKEFGSLDAWETEFRRIGAGLSGGSGWVVLGFNLHTGQAENYWLWDHMHFPASTVPLLVMDMYEHSYQMDYGAVAAKYIDAFFRNIRWEIVSERLDKARLWARSGRESS